GRRSDQTEAYDARLAALTRRITALEQAARQPARDQEAEAHPQVQAPGPFAQPAQQEMVTPPMSAGHLPSQPAASLPSDVHPASAAAQPASPSRPPLASMPRPVSAPAGRPPSAGIPPVATRPPRPPAPPIDWERWIGIRGAAVVGAIALGLAGILFFKYSIEQGLVTPTMRVVFGTLTGLGCLLGAEWLRSRKYRQTAEAISGAGVVILYAAFWASF